MSIEVYYRWDELDKKHEYSIVLPFRRDADYPPYWNYWVWYYLGVLTRGEKTTPRILPFANNWDVKSKRIKTYKNLFVDAETCAKRIINTIQKHYAKKH